VLLTLTSRLCSDMKYTAAVVIAVLVWAGMGRGQANHTASHTVRIVVADVAVLDVSGNVNLELEDTPQAGAAPLQVSDDSALLRYTTTSAPGTARRVTAALIDGEVPGGTLLALETAPSGGADRGAGGIQVELDYTAQEIITGIGSCATGRSPNQGAQLNYTLKVLEPELLSAGSEETLTVLFTLCDDF